MAMTVKQKQWQLYFLDFYDYSRWNIDGIWGDGSESATASFQRHFGLNPTGIFDEATEEKSKEVIRKIQEAAKVYTPDLVVDGLAGIKTVNATKVLQKALSLAVDGIAGEKTRAKVDEKPIKNASASSSASGDWWDEIKYFKRSEFACKCGKYCNGYPVEPQEKLVRAADKVRAHFGLPMDVSSGVRCSRHNSAVGGVSGSRHRNGKAMDFRVRGKTAAQVLAFVKTLPEIRYCYAINDTYVHMDIL